MMTWNFRIVKKIFDGETLYEVHEVYYDENGAVESWTEEAVHPMGVSTSELKADIEHFLQAFRHPVLALAETGGEEKLVEESLDMDVNTGHYFEVLDRMFVAQDFFASYVASHPVIRKEPGLKKIADSVSEQLGALYQACGQLYSETGE